MNSIDPFEIRKLYKYLRVVNVCDAMDGIGYFDIGLMDADVRPLRPGMMVLGGCSYRPLRPCESAHVEA